MPARGVRGQLTCCWMFLLFLSRAARKKSAITTTAGGRFASTSSPLGVHGLVIVAPSSPRAAGRSARPLGFRRGAGEADPASPPPGFRLASTTAGAANRMATTAAPERGAAPDLGAPARGAAAAAGVPEMSEADRYLFDLNGYVVVRGVLAPDQVRRANDAVDRRAGDFVERSDPELRNARQGTPLYGTGPGRRDLGRVLEWDGEESDVFRSILAHERLVPLFHGLLGEGYRLDHLPVVIAQEAGAEGFRLHGGTVDCQTGEYNPHLAYTCVRDTIRTQLLGCNVMLTDHNDGDGGFCVVPGSHKSNFRMPEGMVDGTGGGDPGGGDDRLRELVRQPATRAGDVVLFSEGTVHGALPWAPEDRPRRACLYRFAPATAAYGRSYFSVGEGASSAAATAVGWPPAVYRGRLTDAQRAVLEPPYAPRLDRPVIADASSGSVKTSGRSDRKKRHDRQVFGTPYF